MVFPSTANVGIRLTNADSGLRILPKQKKHRTVCAMLSLRIGLKIFRFVARSGKGLLDFGWCGGFPGIGDFFVNEVNQAEVEQQNADAGNGGLVVFRFHCYWRR